MSRRVGKTVAVLAVILTVVTIIAGVVKYFNFSVPEREAPDLPAYYDNGNGNIDIEMPGEDASQAEIKQFIADLYNLACANYQAEDKAAFEVRYTTTMSIGGVINIPVPGSRYCVKDGDKRYYLDFTIPGDEMMGMVSSLPQMVPPESCQYAEAVYTDATMDYMISRKAYNDCVAPGKGVGPHFDDNGAIVADWTYVETKELDKIVYAAYQEGNFRHTDHDVSVDTILSGEVSYVEEFGYYLCEFELDPDKVPQALLDSLRESSGQSTARYTKLVQTMTVWDTGYLRTYHALDYWGTDVGMTSELDFETLYYYANEPEKLDVNNYPYMAEQCHK